MTHESGAVLGENSARKVERADLVLRVMSTYSPSGRETDVAMRIYNYLKSKKMSPQIDPVGNVLCEFGTGKRSVFLCGHMDTVPGELPVKFEGGKISGRGACDAKGPLLALLFAFEDLASDPSGQFNGRVIFAGVTEEERSSAGLTELVRRNFRADYALFGEPGGLSKVTVGYRGHLTLRITIVTPEIHASAPKFVTNSAELLYEVYSALKKTLKAENGGSLDKVSISLTEIKSGTAHNVIPGKTTATIDVRVPIGSRTDQIREIAERLIADFRSKVPDAKISVAYDEPTEPYRVPLSSPLVRAVSRSILRRGSKPQFITKSGTGDMNTYAMAFGVDAVTYGPGEAKLSHSSEENVSLEEIFACSEVVSSAINELISMKTGTNTESKEKQEAD